MDMLRWTKTTVSAALAKEWLRDRLRVRGIASPQMRS